MAFFWPFLTSEQIGKGLMFDWQTYIAEYP